MFDDLVKVKNPINKQDNNKYSANNSRNTIKKP
jgi:hypothetical protein